MICWKRALLGLGLLLAGGGLTVNAAEASPADRSLALVVVGTLDDSIAARIRCFAEEHLGLAVSRIQPDLPATTTLQEAVEKTAGLLDARHEFIVALVTPASAEKAHGIFSPERRVVVVNAAALKPAGDGPEIFARRLEKVVMHGYGILLGLAACPHPNCALFAYANDAELDAMGRNFCPPCQDKVARAAASTGLKTIEHP